MEPLGQVRALIDMTEDDNSEFTNCMIEDILHNLGARIDTRYNTNITHLIWQDGKNEKNLKKCLNSSNIHVVSPLWVVECQQANEKVEENAWPAEIANPIEPIPESGNAEQISDKDNKPDSEGNSESRTPSKKRKVTGAKSKSPQKKTILLSGDDDDDDAIGAMQDELDANPHSPELITPKRRGRPKKTSKSTNEKKRKAGNANDENTEPSPETARDRAESVPKKSPSSSKKNKACSLCLSQVSDFVRDAAYDLAKNHTDFVIFENCDAKYVVVEKPVRTIKVFYALAKGNWIVSAEWILASVAAGKWLNPEDFEFKDLPSKRSRESRSDPRFNGLFSGERVHVRKGVEPGQAILQELFLICGAQIVLDEDTASVVIVAPGESGGVSSKWLLDSLVVFEKLDPEGYLAAPVAV